MPRPEPARVPDPFRCRCPLDPTDLVDGIPRAVEGCPAHRARHAAQRWAARVAREIGARDGQR